MALRSAGEWNCRTTLAAYREITGNMDTVIETDGRSRVVLPGRPHERFLVRENGDGSLLLEPARVVTAAQAEYDETPELRALLERASQSPTVRRSRRRIKG